MKNVLRRAAWTAAVSLACASSALAQRVSPAVAEQVREALSVASADFQRIDIPQETDSNVVLRVELGGQPLTLVAHRHNLRGPRFQVLVQDEHGMEPYEAPEPTTFRGNILEIPGSRVAASIDGGQMRASIDMPSLGLSYGIQPLSDAVEGMAADMHAVYDVRDVMPEGECGVADPHDGIEAESTTANLGTGLALCELAIDSDVQFFNDNGGSINATINDIEAQINGVAAIYESDVQITFEITTIVIRTSEPDPYNTFDAGDLLDQFREEWQGPLNFIKRDAAHLMTGRNLNGSTIGVAWLSAICGNLQYGLSERINNFTSLHRSDGPRDRAQLQRQPLQQLQPVPDHVLGPRWLHRQHHELRTELDQLDHVVLELDQLHARPGGSAHGPVLGRLQQPDDLERQLALVPRSHLEHQCGQRAESFALLEPRLVQRG